MPSLWCIKCGLELTADEYGDDECNACLYEKELGVYEDSYCNDEEIA
jgi:hypothetical protein